MLKSFLTYPSKLLPKSPRITLYRCGNAMSAKKHQTTDKRKRKPSTSDVDEDVKKIKGAAADAVSVTEGGDTSVERLPRKKVALLLCYSGVGYYGMQRQSQKSHETERLNTIEAELLKALLQAGCIMEEAHEELFRCKFERASRTDKGVSALRQIVSLKVALVPDLVAQVNRHMPPEIRLIAYKRVTRAFDSKVACSSRTYGYLMPTFALAPCDALTSESYRITGEVRDTCQRVLERYLGTQNFHNYTSGKKANDRSAYRNMIEVRCNEPFVVGDLEFIKITIRGQSFMLHQIRKMIGVAIAICRGWATIDIMDKAKLPDKLDIPKAPGLGLMLEHVHYDPYNKRYGSDGLHEPLTWEEYEDEIQAHSKKYIYPNIIDTERTQRSMMRYLLELPLVHKVGVPWSSMYYNEYRSALGRAYATVLYERAQHNVSTEE